MTPGGGLTGKRPICDLRYRLSHGVSDFPPRHRNEEVRELIPASYAGVMVTTAAKVTMPREWLGVRQQKCLDHLKENINEVLERKKGRARGLGY